MNAPVLSVRDLIVSVPGPGGGVDAVRGLDIEVARGETLALVGESGCGKSLTALALAGLLPEGVRIRSGTIVLGGASIRGLPERQLRRLRGQRVGMVFQDPMAALNPVLTIGEQIVEAIRAHRDVSRADARIEAEGLLARVRLRDGARLLRAFPHQLSGGMRQRVLIAIAIANRPDVLIADEPTTALDATVQADILALLNDLRRESGMALVMITHDLGLVSRWADRVAVMYAGRAVETQPAATLAVAAAHPYTRALLAARPRRRPLRGPRPRLTEIAGRVPLPGEAVSGCAFADRCPAAVAVCWRQAPQMQDLGDARVACHRPFSPIREIALP